MKKNRKIRILDLCLTPSRLNTDALELRCVKSDLNMMSCIFYSGLLTLVATVSLISY